MKDTVPKGEEASDAEADALENLGLVVAALGESVGVRDIKAVENVLVPIAHKCAARGEVSFIEHTVSFLMVSKQLHFKGFFCYALLLFFQNAKKLGYLGLPRYPNF